MNNMEKAIISLSFDDGRGDNWDVFRDILEPMSIPATFNITTGYVDGSCPEDRAPSAKAPLSVAQVCDLAKHPLVEIALHGDEHLNTEEDIAKGRAKIMQWLEVTDSAVFGFASPGSGLNVATFLNSRTPLFREQISYLRTSLRINRYRWLRTLCRKAGRVIHIPFLYQIAYADTLMISCPDRVVYSIPVMKDATFKQVRAIIDLAIRRRSALTLMFHSVLDDMSQEDNWSWDRKKFVCLCKYLEEKRLSGQLEIMTTKQLTDYL